MKKILLSGLGGSLFPYLHNCLKHKYELFYVDGDINLINLYPDLNFYHAPLVLSEEYTPFIKNIIEQQAIDYYIPLIDEEILKALSLPEQSINIKIISPTLEFCELCLNKFHLMKYLEEHNISNIPSYLGNHFSGFEILFPVFVKPIFGRGSRGIRLIENKEQLDAYYTLEKYKPKDIIIQEYIKGTEYTIGVTTNNLNNILSISIKRIIKKKGITQIAIIEKNTFLETTIRQIISVLKPCGPINIQLYLTEKNEIKIFEINPRFSTTTIMSYEGGVDEISLYIDYYNKEFKKLPFQPKAGVILHRRWENIFYEN